MRYSWQDTNPWFKVAEVENLYGPSPIVVFAKLKTRADKAEADLAQARERIRELEKICETAAHTLRSYQYSNGSAELAKEVADRIGAALAEIDAKGEEK